VRKNLQHNGSIGQVADITPRKISRVQNAKSIGIKHNAAKRGVTTVGKKQGGNQGNLVILPDAED